MDDFVPLGYMTLKWTALDRMSALFLGEDFIFLSEKDAEALAAHNRWKQDSEFANKRRRKGAVDKTIAKDPSISAAELRDLKRKTTAIAEQRSASQGPLRKLLYAGRVPAVIISDETGKTLDVPKFIWGGEQWNKALSTGGSRITIRLKHGSVSGRVLIPSDALDALFNPDGTVKEKPEPVAPEPAAAEVAEQSRRGPKPKWDWEGAIAHLLSVANKPDGLPESQAEIESLVADWFSEKLDDQPAESAIRKHVSSWCQAVLGKASNSPTSN